MAAVVLSPAAYDALAEKAELADNLLLIDRGLEDVKAGRVQDAREGVHALASKYGIVPRRWNIAFYTRHSSMTRSTRSLGYLLGQGAPKERIARWLGELLDVVDDLEDFPRRHSVAEPESTIRGTEIRKLVFGDYLFYQVDDAAEVVVILGFRHGARRG